MKSRCFQLLIGFLFVLGAWGVFNTDNVVFAQSTFPNYEDGSYNNTFDPIMSGNKIMQALRSVGGSSEDGARGLFSSQLRTIVLSLIGTLGLAWVVLLGAKMILAQGDEESLGRYKTEFGWVVVGLFVASLSTFFAFEVLDPTTDFILANRAGALAALNSRKAALLGFIRAVVLGVMLVMGALSAYRFIISGENDDTIETEKKYLQSFGFGVVLILMAEIVVRLLSWRDTSNFSQLSPSAVAQEVIAQGVGLLNYALSFVGILAFIVLILSGILFVGNMGNEDQADKAKKMLIGSIVAITIAFASYTFSAYFVSAA